MKTKLILVLLTAFLLVSHAVAQKSPRRPRVRASVESTLVRLTKKISRASVERDRATLERMMDSDFTMQAANDKFYGKAELIALWTAVGETVSTSTPSDFRVFVYGDTAIVTSLIVDTETKNGLTETFRRRAFDVWRRTKNGWRWISSRESDVR